MESRGNNRRFPVVPDRSVVVAPAAIEALDGILAAGWYNKRFGDLDVDAAWVLATLLRLYADEGKPPCLETIAAVAGMSDAEAGRLIVELHRHDLVLRGEGTQTIQGAYPFTESVTGHNVTFIRTKRSLNTMCVIDALGAGAMCHEDAVVRSACRQCGATVVVHLADAGATLGEVHPPDTVVWAGLKKSCGCAATSLCTEMVPFCAPDHLERWLALGKRSEGRRLTVEEALQVGKALFGDRALRGRV